MHLSRDISASYATCHVCAGLTSENEDTDFLLEASQGDRIVGKVTRVEVASVVASALSTPASTGKLLCPHPPVLKFEPI